MATSDNITPEQIDEEYPIAGQDNDSQGFRDNFAAIQSSLTATKTAVKDLESKVVVKAALGTTVLNNDMQGSIIKNAVLEGVAGESLNKTVTNDADGDILWSDAYYQNITMANSASARLSLGGWPANGVYGKMRLAIKSSGGAANVATKTVIFEAAGAGTIKVDPNFPTGDFTVTSTSSPKIIDVWTINGGSELFMEYIGEFTTA
tara:strand:+ start:3530 stop:4144 length:615 start_codon:yes stop_codon:yes gene_type:complete